MNKCSICGRPLAGLRFDHSLHCAVLAQLDNPNRVARVQLVEGTISDPFSELTTGAFVPVDWIGPEARVA